MNAVLPPDRLAKLGQVVAEAHPNPGHGPLVAALSAALPDLSVKLVYSRKGWHRPGGVIDRAGARIADNLSQWLHDEAGDDLMGLLARYEDGDLVVTKLCGVTHYLTAKTGDGPWDFVQIEVDELREITDRELYDPLNLPDGIEDLVDPVDPIKVDPTALGPAFYQMRQAWDIAEAHAAMAAGSSADSLLVLRFVDDWCASSARSQNFCDRFVLHLTEYRDRFGEKRLQATPMATHVRALPPLPGGADRGVDLSRFLTAFDRAVGYPMAWYFHMVSGIEPGLQGVAHAVHEDVTGAYDYLPQVDVDILTSWIGDRYTF